MGYGKTITTYLVDGSSTGIKTVELSNWVGKAIIIPRQKLKEAKDRNEVLQPAIYFLFGINDDGNGLAYIGEAENLINRIGNHDTNKDFWDVVIGFISKDNNLTKADVKYLEAKAIERAKKVNRFVLQNGVEPIPNNLPEYQLASMNEFLDNIDLLISAIGYPIIKEIKENFSKNNIYFCKGPNADAFGFYTDEGFLVQKGSKVRKQTTLTAGSWINGIQKKLLEEKILEYLSDEELIFSVDYLFNSPSASAGLILGRRANGWLEWKNKEGKSLDEIERRNLKDI